YHLKGVTVKYTFCLLSSFASVAGINNRPKEVPPIPTEHTRRDIEGWTVFIDNRLLSGDGKTVGDHALRILSNRLYDIKHIVPADKVKALQKGPIWLDQSHGKLVPAQYHPSKDWLKPNR